VSNEIAFLQKALACNWNTNDDVVLTAQAVKQRVIPGEQRGK
jgi:hypothetical protein